MILKANQQYASLVPVNHDRRLVTTWGGSLNMVPTEIEYYLNSSLIETLAIVYNTDEEVESVTNAGGDVWTSTYDGNSRLLDWIKT